MKHDIKQDIDALIDEMEKSFCKGKVIVFRDGKILEIDHNFKPPIVKEIKKGKK